MSNTVVPTKGVLVECSRSLEALAESEQRFRALVESLPDAILVHSDEKIVFVNAFCVRLFGADSPDSLVGRNLFEIIGSSYQSAIRTRIEECYATGMASAPMESTMLAWDGSSIDVEAVAIPISWNGAPAIEVVLRDIRRRKQAEHAALEWQKRMELAQKSGLRIGLWDWNVSANAVVWSDETYRQFGFTRETFSGNVKDAVARIHPEDRPRVENAIGEVLEGGAEYGIQYRLVHPDGTVVWIDAHGVIVRNGSTHMLGVGLDITDLKNSEESLRRSEEKYRDLFENAIYGIYRADPEGNFLNVNPALVTMLGYSTKEELLGKNLTHDVYENAAARQAILENVGPQGRNDGAEVNWRRKNGTIFPVRLSGRLVRGGDGSVSHYEVIVEDISVRRNLEMQFRQAQKMEAIGLLAGGISHDFNNHLSVILGNAELLLEADVSVVQRRRTDEIRAAALKAAQLTRQLLAFSRKQVLFPTVLDLNAIVHDVVKILGRLIGEDICVKTELGPDLACIQADRGQVEQILMNLATNARDAMPNGGRFIIRTANCELTSTEVARYPGAKVGPYVRLSVTDTGVGMSEEVQSRIFEPFFTTKSQGRGTGLGLATLYGVVKQSDGYVWVSSTPGAGTTFDVYFPRVLQKADPSISPVESRCSLPRGTETILLVEDDDCLRDVAGELLTVNGYKVLKCGCADEALRTARAHPGAIPLIISDVVLPDMQGPSIVAELQRLHPEARVLYISGYTETPLAQQLASQGAMFLQKPVPRDQLLRKIDSILHPSAAS